MTNLNLQSTLRLGAILIFLTLSWPNPAWASAPGLSVENGRFLKDGRPYRGVGANYFDLFLRVLHNSNDLSSCEGLKKLSAAGIPFVRFAGGGFSASEWRMWTTNKEQFFRSLDVVVKTAEQAKIGLIPSLFWTQIFPDLVDEPRDQWGNPGSKTIALMRRYVDDVVGRYKNSPAIWAWEFGNEMSLAADLPNAAQFRKKGGAERDDLKSAHLVTALSEFAKAVRRADAHRAIISGNSHPRMSAWHNTRERSWKADSREQTLEIILRDNPAPLDTIGIHFYGDHEVQKEAAAWAKDNVDYLRTVKELAQKSGRPVFVGEFGLAATDDEAKTRAVFEGLLAAMETAQIDLAAFWVFDFPIQDKDWNATFENSRACMIQLSAEANRRWNAAAGP